MADLTSLIKSLAEMTGLSEEMARDVLETATEYVKTQRPDKAAQVDAALEDERVARRATDLIGKLSRKVEPPASEDEVS
jgi:HEPN domain-containing protein